MLITADAGFDQPAGQETALAPAVASIAIAGRGWLATEIERVGHRAAGEQLESVRAEVVDPFHRPRGVGRTTEAVELADQRPAVVEAAIVDPGHERQIRRRKSGSRRVARIERAVCDAQVGRTGHKGGPLHADVLRQAVGPRSAEPGGDHAEIGMFAVCLRSRIGDAGRFAGEHFDAAVVVGRHFVMQRADERKLSARCASSGRYSQISIPGTFVRMGERGPRYSLGASGFMSNVSSWLGPPHIQNRITAVSRELVPASARHANNSASVKPPRAMVPTRRNSRRGSGPGQKRGLMRIPRPPEPVGWLVQNASSCVYGRIIAGERRPDNANGRVGTFANQFRSPPVFLEVCRLRHDGRL